MAMTARSEGHRVLYQWEKFCVERLSALLRDKRIYCSNPVSFNDPWDCLVLTLYSSTTGSFELPIHPHPFQVFMGMERQKSNLPMKKPLSGVT